MYQVELKRTLVERLFPAAKGWKVTVDLDAMEMGKGPQNPQRKRVVATKARRWLEGHGVLLRRHERFGRADLVAEHPRRGTVVLEVEGDSSRQKEQALYSALGQLVLSIQGSRSKTRYGLAVPDTPPWRLQVAKIPNVARKRLRLKLMLVSQRYVRIVEPGALVPI